MAVFDFVLMGNCQPQRLDVPTADLATLAEQLVSVPFITAETQPDEWGVIRRVLVKTSRIQMVSEAE